MQDEIADSLNMKFDRKSETGRARKGTALVKAMAQMHELNKSIYFANQSTLFTSSWDRIVPILSLSAEVSVIFEVQA
ncbi:hypothetical protein KIW84_020358 [Lathyrus oleraceus]|uniref:Uncharacterized protein n=1 Tax=Pisum sativum TaxID=3888 RepID=A0A9D5B2G4_PEA|nr:hypothetical protein KIW84_020358 [Pisum sativum]